MRNKVQTPYIQSRLRSARVARGLSQQELATRIGLTRQAVISIESGRYVPNTTVALRLAQVLGCRVEDLFALPESETLAPVKVWSPTSGSDSRLVIAKVGDRLVGHALTPSRPAFEGFASADGLCAEELGQARLLRPVEQLARTGLVMGCDPSLSILSTHVSRQNPELRLTCVPACSLAALEAVARGGAHIAGSHLREAASGECNLGHAQRALASTGGIVVTLATWEQGLMVLKGNPRKVRSIQDLARRGVRFINREVGAGARAALDESLGVAGVPAEAVAGYDRIAQGHFATALAVVNGAADVGMGLRAVSSAFDLEFVPLLEVRFDLVIPQDHLEHPVVKTLLDLLQTRQFRADLASLPGYDVRQTGSVQARFPRPPRA